MEIALTIAALLALTFSWLWLRDRRHVSIAETARDGAVIGRENAERQVAALKLKVGGLEKKVAELQPLADEGRKALDQRANALAAAQAANAKRRAASATASPAK